MKVGGSIGESDYCTAILRLFLTLLVSETYFEIANAQTPALQPDNTNESDRSASELLKKPDQFVEQNQELENQNRELMDQIES